MRHCSPHGWLIGLLAFAVIAGRASEVVAEATPASSPSPSGLGVACADGRTCPSGATCFSAPRGTCLCEPGLQACESGCAEVGSDPHNCGACGQSCAKDQFCSGGLCLTAEKAASIGLNESSMAGSAAFEGSSAGSDPAVHVLPPLGSAGAAAAAMVSPGGQLAALGGFFNAAEPISAFDPDECSRAMEAHVSRLGNGFGAAYYYGPDQCGQGGIEPCPLNNFASPFWWNFTNDFRTLPTAANTCIKADPWTTRSPAGRFYAAFIGKYGSESLCSEKPDVCLAIAGTLESWMPFNGWFYPATCVGTTGQVDGPAIYYDPGGTDLWATFKRDGTAHAYIMKNCTTGQPGGAACPVTSDFTAGENVSGHPNVVVNPCTHHGVFGYRTTDEGGSIDLAFYTRDGDEVNTWTAADGVEWEQETGCNYGGGCVLDEGNACRCNSSFTFECTGTGGGGKKCNRLIPRVNMDVTYDWWTNRCYLYMTYPRSCQQVTSNTKRIKSSMAVVDITDENNPFVARQWISSDCDTSRDSDITGAIAAANYQFFWPSATVGWSFTRSPDGDACAASRVMYVDNSLTFDAPYGEYVGYEFPIIVGFGNTMGDYDTAVPRGQPGAGEGYVHTVYSAPFPMSQGVDCHDCMDEDYAIRVLGVRGGAY